MMFKRVLFIFFLLSFLLFAHTSAWALVASNDFFGFDFRFNNPGARSTAMGGAFVGLADDATAAYANPAGLTILTEPEISAEIKYGEYTNRVPQETDTDDFTDPNAIIDPDDIEIDDTFEIHAGVEYVMSFGDVPFALRCGYFYRPDHSARYVGPITSPDDQALKDRLASKDYDEHIFSAGFGTVLFDILQVDVAASYGELITEGTLSVVYRF